MNTSAPAEFVESVLCCCHVSVRPVSVTLDVSQNWTTAAQHEQKSDRVTEVSSNTHTHSGATLASSGRGEGVETANFTADHS